MFMISRETISSVMSLKEKIGDPKKKGECIGELENMIEMKESHLARADWGSCCGSIRSLAPQIESELELLRNILVVLQRGDGAKAESLLQDYLAFLQKNYSPEPEHW